MNSPNQKLLAIRKKHEDVRFVASAFADLIAFVGHVAPETGGLLLGSREDYIVRKFIFDESGSRSYSSYDPDVAVLNKIVKREWEDNGLQLIGWAHSHPRGVERLSGDYGAGTGDIAYLKRIFCAIPGLSKFIVPIVFSSHDGPLCIYPYLAYRDRVEDYQLCKLVVASAGSEETQPKMMPPTASEIEMSAEIEGKATKSKSVAAERDGDSSDEPAHQSISTLA